MQPESIEALWSLRTEQVPDVGPNWLPGGVVVFETGRVFGGDSYLYYMGTYRLSGETLTARVRVVSFQDEPAVTVFGDYVTDREVICEGTWKGDTIDGVIYRVEDPELRLRIVLVCRAYLP